MTQLKLALGAYDRISQFIGFQDADPEEETAEITELDEFVSKTSEIGQYDDEELEAMIEKHEKMIGELKSQLREAEYLLKMLQEEFDYRHPDVSKKK